MASAIFELTASKNAQVVGGKEISLRVIESDHADHALQAFERHGERGVQRAVFRSIV
jgi:hypothetical protein